ncbi:MAG: hypothetical protein C6I00_05130 [Nitratiruptor sp.]|nr:hypothetical protein [Nitratiruptor sp.]NPA84294.1 hypothetical protein [Campylobacterota bacterium]
MEKLPELLNRFEGLLQEENRLLIESITSKEAARKILQLVEEKERLLQEIRGWEREQLAQYKELLERIDTLTQRNKALAINNIEFINEIFDAVFSASTPPQYTKDGSLSTKREGFFNKKV